MKLYTVLVYIPEDVHEGRLYWLEKISREIIEGRREIHISVGQGYPM